MTNDKKKAVGFSQHRMRLLQAIAEEAGSMKSAIIKLALQGKNTPTNQSLELIHRMAESHANHLGKPKK